MSKKTKICPYCANGMDILDQDFDGLNVRIEGNSITIIYNAYSTDSSFSETFSINYCPKCGEPLTKKIDMEISDVGK